MADDKKKKKKKKEKEEDNREEILAKLFQSAATKYPGRVLKYAADVQVEDIPRVSTNVMPMDFALGGGLPIGRISLFYGHKSTSKTVNYLRPTGIAQRSCSNCWTPAFPLWMPDINGMKPACQCGDYRRAIVAWVDVEGTYDKKWYSRFCDTEKLVFSQPSVGEQAIDICDTLLRAGAVDIIVIDSIAFLTPQEEIDGSASDIQVGAQARLMGKATRKFVSGINEIANTDGRRPSFWLVNQIRMKVGVMFGSPETQPAGLACGFSTSVEVRTSRGKYKMDDETGKPLSVEMKAKVSKNKTAPANMECEFRMATIDTDMKTMGSVIDEPWAVRKGLQYGLIDRPNPEGTTYVYEGEKYHGLTGIQKFFMVNREAYYAYREKLMPLLLAS